MKQKLWVSTSIASLLLGGIVSPISYADSLGEGTTPIVWKSITNSEEQTAIASSSFVNSSLEIDQEIHNNEINTVDDANIPKESAISQGMWGTATYEFDKKTGTLAVSNGKVSRLIEDNLQLNFDVSDVKHIIFGNGVTAPDKLSGVFTRFHNLISVSGDLDTSAVTDMSYTFYSFFDGPLINLTNVDVSNWNTSLVTTMDSMFEGTSSLTSVDPSKWDTSLVTTMDSMFKGASSLVSIDLSEWNTSRLERITAMFKGASSLTSVDLSKWNTSNMLDIGALFQNASSLTSVDLSKWNTSKVFGIDDMFNGATSLTSLDISNFDTSSVIKEYSDNVFNNTTNLSSITLGPKTIFIDKNTNLPEIEISSLGNSGKWVKTDGATSYASSSDFMLQYDGRNPGTYVWQRNAFSLDVKDIEIYEGESWKASDGFVSGSYYVYPASKKVETKVDFTDPLMSVAGDERVDTTTPGVYHVTYKLGNVDKQTTVTVKENQQAINGSDFTMTVGDAKPTASDFKAAATGKDGKEVEVTVDLSKADVTTVGSYDVVLNSSDGQSKTVKLTVLDNKQSLTGSDFTITVGDAKPTVSDFKATATGKDGKEVEVTVDLSKADIATAGSYDVELSTSDGQSKTVKLTVKDKVVTDNEITTPSTGDKGTNSGTSTSVVNSSNNTIKTPSSGNYPSSSLPKTGDESSISSIVIGLVLALISLLTLGFVRKRNK